MLFVDSISVKYLIANPVMHVHLKTIEIGFHFICENICEEQVVDALTKPLPELRFIFL